MRREIDRKATKRGLRRIARVTSRAGAAGLLLSSCTAFVDVPGGYVDISEAGIFVDVPGASVTVTDDRVFVEAPGVDVEICGVAEVQCHLDCGS